MIRGARSASFAISALLLGASATVHAQQPAPTAPPSAPPPSTAQPPPSASAPPAGTPPPANGLPPPAPPPVVPKPRPAAPPAASAPPPGSPPPQGYPQGYPPPQGYPQGYPPPQGYPQGYSPYPYYPYPYYPYPYPYPSSTAAPKPRPREMPYDPGKPIPEGYHLETRANRKLIGAGAGVLGGAWIFSVVLASVIIDQNSGNDLGYGPLFAPVLGPFIALGTSTLDWDQDGYVGAFLVLDGLAQVGGAAMLIAGLVRDVKLLVRDPDKPAATPAATGLVPDVRIGAGSGSLTWRF